MWSTISASAFLGYALVVYAQSSSIARTCPRTDLCYRLNIPDATKSSGEGDIYFQISAPTTYQWVALGQGSSMSGSNIFVVYTNSDGTNVTVSPRIVTGHNEPQHDTDAQIELLEGSGVTDGMMTANVKCSNCNSWQGGSMDFSGSNANWIYAYRTGSPLASDDVSEGIGQHNAAAPFRWDLAQAQGGENVNPFVASSGSTGPSTASSSPTCRPRPTSATVSATGSAVITAADGCPTAWPSQRPTARPEYPTSCYEFLGRPPWATSRAKRQDTSSTVDDSNLPYCDNDSNSSTSDSSSDSATFSNANVPFGGNISLGNRVITIHGILASLAFIALFPVGGILIRIASFTGVIWVHAAMQILAYLIYIAAFGMGIWLATELDLMGTHHPVIGIVLFVVLLTQPASGWVHHLMFKKKGGRTAWSHVHLTVGRVAILLGMVNGGLGLRLAGASNSARIAYAVCAALVAVVYIACLVFGELKRKKQGKGSAQPSTYDEARKRNSHRPLGSEDGVPLQEHFAKSRH